MLGCFATLVIAWAPETARAQTPPPDASYVAERSSIHNELDTAVALYVASGLTVTGGAIAVPLGLLELTSCPVPTPTASGRDCTGGIAAYIGGLVAIPLGVILFAIAIGLDVDAHSRRGALRARGVSIAPGPGEVGLAIALRF